MQLTARLKNIDELKKLESFDSIDEHGNMFFKSPSLCINRNMFELGLVSLKWSKKYKTFASDDWVYNLEWITDIMVSDDKLKLGLAIDGLALTIKVLEQSEEIRLGSGVYKSYKDKFEIKSLNGLQITPNKLYIYGIMRKCYGSTYRFKSNKKLVKWIRNLIKCTENGVELNK